MEEVPLDLSYRLKLASAETICSLLSFVVWQTTNKYRLQLKLFKYLNFGRQCRFALPHLPHLVRGNLILVDNTEYPEKELATLKKGAQSELAEV